jgi:hypothetical protein
MYRITQCSPEKSRTNMIHVICIHITHIWGVFIVGIGSPDYGRREVPQSATCKLETPEL